MVNIIHTATLCGIDSKLCVVEADISEGLPVFDMVGFLGSEVKEAKERVRAALKNQGYSWPVKRITVNLSPANIKKNGTGYDLPIALAIIKSIAIDELDTDGFIVIGEISLDGRVLPVSGVLPMVLCAYESGLRSAMVPMENLREASLVPGMKVIGVSNIQEAYDYFAKGVVPEGSSDGCLDDVQKDNLICNANYDFSMINGQPMLRRACEVAISGMHNLLMVGPPGAGKSMIAKCIPTILPPMTMEEKVELSKIYSVCGEFSAAAGLMEKRPFRNPHHTISQQGLVGGGTTPAPRPGEVSMAHKGVLFLDELTEFHKATLEVLRQPLEDKTVSISRASGTYIYPADFVLVAAMNPCSCGYYPDMSKCRCTENSIMRYMSKISQPLLDRIDICVEAPTLTYDEVVSKNKNESSESIRERVMRCHELQRIRYEGLGFSTNAGIPSDRIEEFCHLNEKEFSYMQRMYEAYELTARTYHKVLKVARTIADMDGKTHIELRHLQEAMCYRGLDKRYWEKR